MLGRTDLCLSLMTAEFDKAISAPRWWRRQCLCGTCPGLHGMSNGKTPQSSIKLGLQQVLIRCAWLFVSPEAKLMTCTPQTTDNKIATSLVPAR